MGTYYRYVNFTRREFFGLSDLREGGDKENAVLYCAPALAWLLLWPHACGDGYRGRWHARPAEDIRVVSDGEVDFYDMTHGGTREFDEPFLNISPGLLQSMRTQVPGFVQDYHPRRHDVALVARTVEPGMIHKMPVAVHATCSCGWRCGPLFGENREQTLAWVVSDHVSEKQTPSQPRDPRPFTYRADLSSEDVCDLVEALDEVTSGKSGEFPRLRALRDRLADLRGTR